jgi:hypothetical protein
MEARAEHDASLSLGASIDLVTFNSFPVELCSMIFQVAQQSEPWKLKGRRALLLVILCQSVCKLWRSLLPPPTIKVAPHISYKFDCVAARAGYLSVLQWVVAHGGRLQKKMCQAASLGGRLDVLKWLKTKGFTLAGCRCTSAAKSGNLEVLKWVFDQGAIL